MYFIFKYRASYFASPWRLLDLLIISLFVLFIGLRIHTLVDMNSRTYVFSDNAFIDFSGLEVHLSSARSFVCCCVRLRLSVRVCFSNEILTNALLLCSLYGETSGEF